jgi:hypothetical protein
MGLFHGSQLFRTRFRGNAAGTVEAGMITNIGVANHSAVNIRVMDHSRIYIYNGSIIPEMSSRPASTAKTPATISETIINTAIKTYSGAPIALMISIVASFITPIAGCP